jgi:hypothetical protein
MITPSTMRGTSLIGLGILLLGGCSTPQKTNDPSLAAAESPQLHYTVRAGDSIWMAKTIRFEGQWMILEAWPSIPGDDRSPPETKTVWIPREELRYIERPK